MEELYQAIKAMDSSDNQDKMISEAQKLLSGQAPNARDAAVLGMAGILGLAHPFGVAVKVIAEQGKLVREQQERIEALEAALQLRGRQIDLLEDRLSGLCEHLNTTDIGDGS